MFDSFSSHPLFWIGILAIVFVLITPLLSPKKGTSQKKTHKQVLPDKTEISTIVDVSMPVSMIASTDDTSNEIADLSSAEAFITANSLGEELIFSKPNTDNDLSQYREIKIASGTTAASNAIRVAAPIAQQMYSAAQLAQMAPNGLFTSTVNPQLLSHFVKDGTYTTMIHGPKGVVGHGGFKAIPGLNGINPVMALNIGMQTMAAISGQYYLKVINTQLSTIGKKLDDLSASIEDHDMGTIVSSRKRLEVISGHESVGNNDIIEIRSIANEVNRVYETYRIRYLRMKESAFHFSSHEKGTQKLLGNYQKIVDDFKRTAFICAAAYQVSLQAKLIEIAVEMRINPLSEQLRDLERDALNLYNDPFDRKLVTEPSRVFLPIVERAQECLAQMDMLESVKGFFISSEKKREQERDYLRPFRHDVKQLSSFAESVMDMETAKAVVEGMTKEQRILVLPGSDNHPGRLFIAAS